MTFYSLFSGFAADFSSAAGGVSGSPPFFFALGALFDGGSFFLSGSFSGAAFFSGSAAALIER